MATEVERLIQQIQSLPPEDQARIRQALEAEIVPLAPKAERSAAVELQKRLIEAGMLSEFKAPRRDAVAFKSRKPVEIEGKPLSETIIQERR
jgi:hypothetical protein